MLVLHIVGVCGTRRRSRQLQQAKNAEAVAQTARDKLLNLGLDVTVRVIPTATAGEKASTAPARVVLLPRSGVGARIVARARGLQMPGVCTNWRLCGYKDERAAAQRASVRLSSHTNVSLGPQNQPSSKTIRSRRTPDRALAAGPQTVTGQEAGVDLHADYPNPC